MKIVITYDADSSVQPRIVSSRDVKKALVQILRRVESQNLRNPIRTTIVADMPEQNLNVLIRRLTNYKRHIRTSQILFKYVVCKVSKDNERYILTMPLLSLDDFQEIVDEVDAEGLH